MTDMVILTAIVWGFIGFILGTMFGRKLDSEKPDA